MKILLAVGMAIAVTGCAASEFAFGPRQCYEIPKYRWAECPFPHRAWLAVELPEIGYDGTVFEVEQK